MKLIKLFKLFPKLKDITYVNSLIFAEIILFKYNNAYIQKLETNKNGFQEFEIRRYYTHNILYSSKKKK